MQQIYVRVEALSGSYISDNGHSPSTLEQEYLLQIVTSTKEKAREYLREVSVAVRLLDLARVGLDLVRAGQDYLDLVLSPEYRVQKEIQGKKPLVVYAGGFGTNAEIAEPPMRYLKNQGFNVVFYRYREELYPERKRAPVYLPRGTNVEPLQWQLDDFVDFCVETSDREDQELAIVAESKSGLLAKLAFLLSKELRGRTKVVITGGAPGPVIENINTVVLERYIHWLDEFDADDFMFTRLLTPYNAQKLERLGLISFENPDDGVIGAGVKVGNVITTSVFHSAMFRNRRILSVVSGKIRQAFGVQEEEEKGQVLKLRPRPRAFEYNPLLA